MNSMSAESRSRAHSHPRQLAKAILQNIFRFSLPKDAIQEYALVCKHWNSTIESITFPDYELSSDEFEDTFKPHHAKHFEKFAIHSRRFFPDNLNFKKLTSLFVNFDNRPEIVRALFQKHCGTLEMVHCPLTSFPLTLSFPRLEILHFSLRNASDEICESFIRHLDEKSFTPALQRAYNSLYDTTYEWSYMHDYVKDVVIGDGRRMGCMRLLPNARQFCYEDTIERIMRENFEAPHLKLLIVHFDLSKRFEGGYCEEAIKLALKRFPNLEGIAFYDCYWYGDISRFLDDPYMRFDFVDFARDLNIPVISTTSLVERYRELLLSEKFYVCTKVEGWGWGPHPAFVTPRYRL